MRPIVPRFARLRAGLAAVFAFAGLLAACQAKLPTREEIDRMDVATESREAEKSSQADTTIARPVDGAKVPTADSSARAVDDVRVARASPREPKRVDVVIRKPAPTAAADDSGRVMLTAPLSNAAAGRGDTLPGLATFIGRNQESFSPLIFIDGVRATVSEMKALDRERIESVEVLKGPYAKLIYNAEYGVIAITTKRGGTN